MFSASFSEIVDEAGKQLEQVITAMSRQKGNRHPGLNRLGLYYPETNLLFHAYFTRESSSISFIGQSSGNNSLRHSYGSGKGSLLHYGHLQVYSVLPIGSR